jgi:hypothetical protein
MMRSMPILPSFSTRSPSFAGLGRVRGRGRRRRAPTTMNGLLSEVIAAVNARGLCAAEVSRLAHLPDSEVAAMATRCGCRDCFVLRAN